jgi:hypothetical protein
MIYLQHSNLTSLRTLAKLLNDELGKVTTIYNLTELQNFIDKKNKVAIVENSLKDSIDKILVALKSEKNKDILPKVLIARGNATRNDLSNNRLNFESSDKITLINKNNKDDKIFLEGSYIEYETDIQFIILSRNQSVSFELQIELKRILVTALRQVFYKLRVYDDTAPDEFYETDDFGKIDLLGLENATFEAQTDEDTNIFASYLTGVMSEAYFKLDSANTYKKYEIEGIPQHLKEEHEIPFVIC